jgi:hypothetical protein
MSEIQPELWEPKPTGLTTGWWSPAPSAGSEAHFIDHEGRSLCGEWCWLGEQISGTLHEAAPESRCAQCDHKRRAQGL